MFWKPSAESFLGEGSNAVCQPANSQVDKGRSSRALGMKV